MQSGQGGNSMSSSSRLNTALLGDNDDRKGGAVLGVVIRVGVRQAAVVPVLRGQTRA